MTEQLYSTEDAAALLNVPPDLISKWRHRGRVVPAGLLSGRGRGGQVPVYRLDELRPLALAYHRRRARDTPPPAP